MNSVLHLSFRATPSKKCRFLWHSVVGQTTPNIPVKSEFTEHLPDPVCLSLWNQSLGTRWTSCTKRRLSGKPAAQLETLSSLSRGVQVQQIALYLSPTRTCSSPLPWPWKQTGPSCPQCITTTITLPRGCYPQPCLLVSWCQAKGSHPHPQLVIGPAARSQLCRCKSMDCDDMSRFTC